MQMQMCFDTRAMAAESIKPHKTRLHRMMLEWFEAQGEAGGTDEEGTAACGIEGNTWRPRRGELEVERRLKRTERTRPTKSGRSAVVFVATEFFQE